MFRKGLCFLMALAVAGTAWAASDAEVARLGKLAEEAAQRAATETLEPNEVNTIVFRRLLMGKPGLQFYVVFFNDVGQPIEYFVTQGKCTSSNKRLQNVWHFEHGQTGRNNDGPLYGDFVVPSADLDGTHGHSDTYVYCKTADGKYKQWNGRYYISDAPIELTIKPLVIDTSGKTTGQH